MNSRTEQTARVLPSLHQPSEIALKTPRMLDLLSRRKGAPLWSVSGRGSGLGEGHRRLSFSFLRTGGRFARETRK